MRVGIVGAGITGLVTSFALDRAGVDHLLFEASETPGGVIRSHRVDGRVLDSGPQRLRLTPAVAGLVDRLGLSDATVSPAQDSPLYVYVDGRLEEVPLDVRTFLRTGLLSSRAKLRMLAEPFTRPGEASETVEGLFDRKFGTEAASRLFGPLVGGIYASDPADMIAGHALPRLLAMEDREGSILRGVIRRALTGDRPDTVTFEEGMAMLPKALFRTVENHVRLGTPVRSVHRNRGSYSITTQTDQIPVDRVVVTTPACTASDIVREPAPTAASNLNTLSYRPLAVVHLLSDLDRNGMGYQVHPDEGFRTLGVTWNGAMFGRDGVVTCFLPDGAAWPDHTEDSLGTIARDEFRSVTGADATVMRVTRLRPGVPAYDQSWSALAWDSLPPGLDLAGSYRGGPGIPSRIRTGFNLATTIAQQAQETEPSARAIRPRTAT